MGVLVILNFHDPKLQRVDTRFIYEPTGKFVDNRGYILEKVKDYWQSRKFKHDRVQFREKNNYDQGMITWKRSICKLEDKDTDMQYINKLQNTFSRDLWEKLNVSSFKSINIKFYFIKEQEILFNEVANKLKNLYSVSEQVFETVGLPYSDIGIPIVFEDSETKVNFKFGPMEQKQMLDENIFSAAESLPEVAIFSRVEYKYKEPDDTRVRNMIQSANEFARNNCLEFIRKSIEEIGE